MKYKFLVTAIVLVLAQTLNAQETKKLTLQQAIELSVKNSGQLKNSQAKIEEATWALKEAIERKLPDVSAFGSYLRLSHADVNLKTKNNNTSSGTTENTPSVSQAMYGILNVSYPVYAGNRIKYGIEAAKYLAEAAKLDADNDRAQVELNTINAYINLYKAKAAVALVNENLETAKQRVKDLANMEKNGLLARNDLMKAELQQSNTELSLLDAENNWKLANLSVNLLLGLPENTIIETDAENLPSVNQLKGIEEYEQMAIQNRKDIAALSLRKKAAGTAVKATKAEQYPSLALTGGYIAANIPGLITITNAVNVGVGVQYSLSSLWKNRSKVEQAKSREKQLQINEGILNDAVRLQIHETYENYLLSVKKIEVYQKAIDQAAENYRIIKNKYGNSLATTTDLLDADVAQLQAKLNYSNAKADAVFAYNRLLQSTGSLNYTNK